MSLWRQIGSDVHRYRGRASLSAWLKCLLLERTYRPLFTLRLCQHLARRGPLARLAGKPLAALHKLFCAMAGMDLPWRTAMAEGILICHGWGLVSSHGAQIGRNVTLFHGVTLGRKDTVGHDGVRQIGYPVIEDEVWIGPHAIIVGGVRVGRGSRIGGGCVVTKDIPANSLVVGNPMVIKHSEGVADVVNPAPL